MRLAGSAVLGISAAATLAVAASWITGFYVWEVAVPVLFGTITAGVLAGTVARGQSFAIDLNAARLELMLDPEPRPSAGGKDVDSWGGLNVASGRAYADGAPIELPFDPSAGVPSDACGRCFAARIGREVSGGAASRDSDRQRAQARSAAPPQAEPLPRA